LVSPFPLSNSQLAMVFPGFSSNTTQGTPASTQSPVYAWTYAGKSFVGSYGAATVYSLNNGTVSQSAVTYLAGIPKSSSHGNLPATTLQTYSQGAEKIATTQEYGFVLSSLPTLTTNGEYIGATASVVLLLGVVRVARGREVKFAAAMENAQGLTKDELDLFTAVVVSGKERTGKEILEQTGERFGTGWYDLLPKLLRFRELGLVETMPTLDHGIPVLKWVSRVF